MKWGWRSVVEMEEKVKVGFKVEVKVGDEVEVEDVPGRGWGG